MDEWIDRNGKERKCNKSKKDKYEKKIMYVRKK